MSMAGWQVRGPGPAAPAVAGYPNPAPHQVRSLHGSSGQPLQTTVPESQARSRPAQSLANAQPPTSKVRYW